MGERDRLFRVIVLGGIGMIGASVEVTACGSSSVSGGTPVTQNDASFPTEGPAQAPDAGGSLDAQGDTSSLEAPDTGSVDAADDVRTFPSETALRLDASQD